MERKLAMLEGKFGQLEPHDILLVKCPLLKEIKQSIAEAEAAGEAEAEYLRKAALEENPLGNCIAAIENDPWPLETSYCHTSFVMGQGYMAIDHKFQKAAEIKQQLLEHPHPAVNLAHPAGHLSAEKHVVDPTFVGPNGVEVRNCPDRKHFTAEPASYDGEFWLDKLYKPRRAMRSSRMSGDVITDACRRNREGKEPKAVDWLGKMKRGDPEEDIDDVQQQWHLPSWMY